ncbi:hypothetical protein SLEP1_g39066 [Rubroshorea leprosula]|uniref:KIB1-4 beta-propeller domain-containing protein n=1 Tax=Rubroshorea leprosula TaxID=152421 RepID=A0AAV5KZD8_9ROSI|nr:hypothetical protein SLEP1_g39066 [Rubroshorea leprosula]
MCFMEVRSGKEPNSPSPVPLLMLPFDDESETSRSFYSILEDKVYHIELTRGKYFCGSSDGSGEKSSIDSHAEMQQSFIHKIVLSHTPTSSSNRLAAAIYGYYQLAYCRCKDQKWTAFDKTKHGFEDVIFHGGKIYAVMQSGPLIVAETDSFPLEFVPVPVNLSNISEFSWKYLVGSSDGLMLVSRFLHSGPYVYKTVKF